MNMARILTLTQRIIRQILHDKRTLVLIFIVPLLVMGLLDVVLTSSTTTHTLAIVRPTGAENDQVNQLLDKLLPSSDKLQTISIQAQAVDQTLTEGKADAVLIFPSDFAQQIAQGKKPTVHITLEGSDPTVASALHDATAQIVGQLGLTLAAQQATQQTTHTVANQYQKVLAQYQKALQQLRQQQIAAGKPSTGSTPAGSSLPALTGTPSVQPTPPTEQPIDLQKALPLTLASPSYLYGGANYTFNDSIAPVFIGIFSFFFIFLLTSVAFLRERSQGTIERVLISPLTRVELVAGYIIGFTIFALVQAIVVLLFVIFVLQVHYSGNLALVFLVSLLLTIGSVNLGIFLSTFARNEFQIIQLIPLVLGSQILLSGAFWPVKQLPQVLRPISYILPLTYANDALRNIMLKGQGLSGIWQQLLALCIFAILMIILSSLTIRREVA
jgi:ABC-type multidrug transport system, permease component